MLKKKIGKIVTASMVSACMLANTTVTFLPSISSLTASAGEQLGMNDFDDGIGLPWHICESGPGKLKFNISGGTYNITIVNRGGAAEGGESRWDVQFRHRGLAITSGHTYTVKAEVTADQSGQIYTKIGSLDGKTEVWHNGYGESESEFGANWKCMPVTANQKLSIESTWTAKTNLEVAEWAWQFGGKGEYQDTDCFENGTQLTFDNLYLIDETSDATDWSVVHPPEVHDYNSVRVNQVGYFTKLAKKATLVVDKGDTAEKPFSIMDSTGKAVYTGTTKPFGYDADSWQDVQIIDFSDFTKPGTYYISCDGGQSVKFEISDNAYKGILTDAVNYYYQNRSGIDIETSYITSGEKSELAHQAGHVKDTAYVQTKWVKSYASDGSDIETSKTMDCTGGWYDAGDHGKYVVNGGISVWTLNNMYERSLSDTNNSKASKWDDKSGTVVVPEAGNKYPDILDETRYEMEWMFKMIETSGTQKGLVHHKMHDHKWTGLAVLPYDYEEEWKTKRIVKPVSYAATLNLAACAAQSARLWADYDKTFADECLANAKLCYDAAKSNWKEYTAADASDDKSLYAPLDQAIGGGAYGDTEVKDDLYWAACELFAATGDDSYYKDLSGYKGAFVIPTDLTGGENKGSFSSFNWGCTAGLGSLSLLLNPENLPADKATAIQDSLTEAADAYIDQENKQGYGIPYHGTSFTDPINIGNDENGNPIVVEGYEWGSNSFVINNAMVMAYAYDFTKDTKYIDGASTAVDYIFGRNALDFSYVTGYGTYHCQRPHHRYWSKELDKAFPMAPSGVMSGGANSGMQDPYIKGMGYVLGEVAPQLCYIDSVESWSSNEVTINWNAPFAWMMSFLEDEAPYVDKNPITTTTTTSTTVPVTGDTLYGDVNCDGVVDVSDIILLARFVAEDAEIGALKPQGKINADCAYDTILNASDVSTIARYLARLIPASEMGPQ